METKVPKRTCQELPEEIGSVPKGAEIRSFSTLIEFPFTIEKFESGWKSRETELGGDEGKMRKER
jgi:hypothetical protein